MPGSRSFAAYCCFTAFCLNPLYGWQGDPVAEKLDKAKQAFGLIMAKTDVTINASLERAETQARVASGELGAQLIGLQRQRYEEFGCTPSLCPVSLSRQRSAANAKLLKAYQFAARDYRRAGDEGKAAGLKLELEKVWPLFMSDPDFGGLQPYGNARIETHGGFLVLAGTGKRAGVVSGRTDLENARLIMEVCASEDVEAWVGVRITADKGKIIGHTSRIKITENGVTAGYSALNFNSTEMGLKSVNHFRKPNQFFKLDFRFGKNKDLWTRMDGKVISGVSHGRTPNGGFGLFILKGTLIVKSVAIIRS